MGFMERSRSLRRKDSAAPLERSGQSPAVRTTARERSATVAAQDSRRPISSRTASSAQSQNRPRTAGLGAERELEQQPPLPDVISECRPFRFPASSESSPRPSTSHNRTLTVQADGSAPGGVNSPRNVPEYKRSFTSTLHVPQASVHQGVVKLSTKELPKLEPTPEPAMKKPVLHKPKPSTWKSFFQRRQSKPSIPEFNGTNLPPLPNKDDKISGATPWDSSPLPKEPIPAPSKVATHARSQSQSRVLARQTKRAEMDKAQFEKQAAAIATKSLALSGVPSKDLRPQVKHSVTEGSVYFEALSRTGTCSDKPADSPPSATGAEIPPTPRLELSIPNAEMERYSVMFEKLLKPRQSLLERRKTAMKGLQLPGEAPASGRLTPSQDTPGGIQRRATSPNLASLTPLTAEFIESTSRMATPVAIHRVSAVPRIQLRRSATAPPGAMSPSVEQATEQRQQPQAADNTSSACSTSHSTIWSEASVPATPDTDSDTETFMSVDDDDDDDDDDGEEADIVSCDAKPLKPTLKEPQWTMIKTRTDIPIISTAPPPIPPKAPGRSAASSRDVSRERLTPQASQEHESQFPPRTTSLGSLGGSRDPSPNPEGRQVAAGPAGQQRPHAPTRAQTEPHPHPLKMHQVHRPVQISVARRVSVRRPSGPSVPSPGLGVRRAEPSRGETTAAPVSMYSKQPLRPTLVEVRNRKSTLVVLDSSSAPASTSTSNESLFPPTPR
ncbi:hypothetical protein BDV97DRAFT_348961 [Delphinella strobiligena]|nr:hypothetical protein BDV97DRAFT_348961 [Delphinella strobiligena]